MKKKSKYRDLCFKNAITRFEEILKSFPGGKYEWIKLYGKN